ncbi:MAG: hypothetical protein HY056_11080 [Proteobacteria bacterium]|nr:hypothetical protein [Pseudomonadota bacterium]
MSTPAATRPRAKSVPIRGSLPASVIAVLVGVCTIAAAPARADSRQGETPSIMMPERAPPRATGNGTARRTAVGMKAVRQSRLSRGRARQHDRPRAHKLAQRRWPLPPVLTLKATRPIPPVATAPTQAPAARRPPAYTFTPGLPPIPNLAPAVSGRGESFGDRAARCTHQMGVFAVPGSASSAYMHNCTMN